MKEKVKNGLVNTNPLTYLAGIPIAVGFVLSAMLYGTYQNTKKIVNSFD